MALYFGKILYKFHNTGSTFIRASIIVLAVSLGREVQCQSYSFTSAYNSGMLSSDRFSIDQDAAILQPSILPEIPSLTISSHVQARYEGFDIYGLGLHLTSPLPQNWGVGMSIRSIGNGVYNSTEILLSTGKILGQKWGIGLSQCFRRSRIGNEGRPWTGSSSVAVSFRSGQWGLATQVTGLIPWNGSTHNDSFSAQIASFVKWETRTQFHFLFVYTKNKVVPVIGIRQTILNNVDLFGAVRLYPARYGLGFSLPLTADLHAIFSTQYHPVLGWSPSVGIRFTRDE